MVKVKKIEKNGKIEPKNIGIKILNKVKGVQNGSTTDKIWVNDIGIVVIDHLVNPNKKNN